MVPASSVHIVTKEFLSLELMREGDVHGYWKLLGEGLKYGRIALFRLWISY